MAAGRRFTRALLLVQLLAAAAAMLVHPSPSPAVLASAGDVARWAFVLAIAAVAAAVIGASAVWGAHLRLRWWGAAIVVLGAAALFVYVSYDEARDARTCPYLGGQVVVGTVMTSQAAKHAADFQIADCGALLAEFSGMRADVWTRASLAESERLLTWLPAAGFALLVGAVLAAIEVAGARVRASGGSAADDGPAELPVSLERLALTSPQLAELNAALRDAFPKAEELDRLLGEQLSKNRHDITLKDNYPGRVFDVLMAARAEGWTERLIVAARAVNPDNPRLRALAAKLGLPPRP